MGAYELGGAIGASAIMYAIGILIAGGGRRLSFGPLSYAFGFVMAGALGTVIAAFGMADGGDLAWNQSLPSYAVPATSAALVAFLCAPLFSREEGNPGRRFAFVLVFVALFVGAVIGQRMRGTEIGLQDDGVLLSDPRLGYLSAVKENYPEVWDDIEAAVRLNQFQDTERLATAFATEFNKHYPEIVRLGGDREVVAASRQTLEKLRYLANTDPQTCVAFHNGELVLGIQGSLTESLLLKESDRLSDLVRSRGATNSGVATAPEAENVLVEAFEELAKTDPELFYAAIDDSAAPRDICNAMNKLNDFMMDRPISEFARVARSPLNLDPTAETSAQANVRLERAYLFADAAAATADLPQRIDQTTVWSDIDFDGVRMRYTYRVESTIRDGRALLSYFEGNGLSAVCEDEYLSAVITQGVPIHYRWIAEDNEVSAVVTSTVCQAGQLQ